MKFENMFGLDKTRNDAHNTKGIRELYDLFDVKKLKQIEDCGSSDFVPDGLAYNQQSQELFYYLKSHGIKFYLDGEKLVDKGYSNKNGKYVFLGMKTPRSYTKQMQINENVPESIKTKLVFLHEMCHHLARELIDISSSFKELFNICYNIRTIHPYNGVSKLADLDFYAGKGPQFQATEDVTELLRLYIMCGENYKDCFECINSRLNDTSMSANILTLLKKSIGSIFPQW